MSSVCVGNDVVDLGNPRTRGRSDDERFLARVFAEQERVVVRVAAEPDLELWCHWAAKEAGFKVISKLEGTPPPFVHRAFEVEWSEVTEAEGRGTDSEPRGAHEASVIRRGTVRGRGHVARVSVALHPDSVHAVAFAARQPGEAPVHVCSRVALLDDPDSAWAGALEELLPRFTEHEADAVYSRPSAAVRVGARGQLAELIGVTERRLEIVCAPGPTSQRPPRLLLDGKEIEADVSLSHDGRLIAWAVWVGADDLRAKDAS